MGRWTFAVVVVALALVAGAGASGAQAAFPPVAWCGADQAAADRVPDATNGFQWHVIYAIPSDGADRFAALAGPIVTDLAAVDAWWRGQDQTRAPRFDLAAFANCASPFGQIDLTRVQLSQPGSAFQGEASRAEALVAALNAAPFGFVDPDKKYLVYYDGAVDNPQKCGQGNAGVKDGGAQAYAFVYVNACAAVVGTGEGGVTITAAHEMIHALDALPFPRPEPGPPHECPPPDVGHPCDSQTDVLYPVGSPTDTLPTRVLDVGRDDYYGHGGSWWDTQDSPFLSRLDSPDQTPPSGPASLDVTSDRGIVTLTWPKATDESPVTYRVYRDGQLRFSSKKRTLRDAGKDKQIVLYGVRAADAVGLLGPLVLVRFKVGLGIVDEKGKLVKDTVPPPSVTSVQASVSLTSFILKWSKVKDRGGPLRGYVVERNGKRYAEVKGTSISIPLAAAKGKWAIRPVDRAGNLAPVAKLITFR